MHLLEQLSEQLQPLASLWRQRGSCLYVVGGAVRDGLLGRPLTDIDICSPLGLETVQKMLQNTSYTLKIKNEQMGAAVISVGARDLEYTGFRRETYDSGGRHQPATVLGGATLEEDARRRDFTVNALYWDLNQNCVIDPLERGLEDLRLKRLWTTSKDPDEILKDDGVRILRLVRLGCQMDFHIPKEVLLSAKKYAKQLKNISKVALRGELDRILLLDGRSEAIKQGGTQGITRIKRALLLLKGIGALEILFPPLALGESCRQNPTYHKYTVLLHNINTCEKMDSVLKLRLAGLLHDVGKPLAWEKNQNMHEHQQIGAEIAWDLLREYGYPAKLVRQVVQLIQEHMFDLTGKAKRATIVRKIIALGPEEFEELICLRRADELGSGLLGQSKTADHWQSILDHMKKSHAPFSVRELAIGGRELKERFPDIQGEEIRAMLERLLLICAKKPSQNHAERLMNHAKRMINDIKREVKNRRRIHGYGQEEG